VQQLQLKREPMQMRGQWPHLPTRVRVKREPRVVSPKEAGPKARVALRCQGTERQRLIERGSPWKRTS